MVSYIGQHAIKSLANGKYAAYRIKNQFEQIKTSGGHAAIDYNTKTGELVLICTKPFSPGSENIKTWGKGSLPEIYLDYYLRLVEC